MDNCTGGQIIVMGRCWDGNCSCNEYQNAKVSDVGMPPFHDGCVCVANCQYGHEWALNEGDGSDDIEYIECEICHKCLSPIEAIPMLSAAEQLDPLKARLYSEHILEDPPFLLDECAEALRAYAKARGV